jgi:hypothetical protein
LPAKKLQAKGAYKAAKGIALAPLAGKAAARASFEVT